MDAVQVGLEGRGVYPAKNCKDLIIFLPLLTRIGSPVLWRASSTSPSRFRIVSALTVFISTPPDIEDGIILACKNMHV
jgi:hypothetical protein